MLLIIVVSSDPLRAFYDDASCNHPDSACIEEPWNLLKIKRMSDIDMREWQGQKSVTADNDSASGSKKLCIFASTNTSQYSKRTVRDYIVKLNETNPVLSDRWGNKIPVTLTLIGIGEATSGVRQNLNLGSVTVRGNNAYTVCRNYEFMIQAEVWKQDILANAIPGFYSGAFSLQVDEISPARSLRSPDFYVALQVNPVAQVSRLKDVDLKVTGSGYSGTMDFCIFTLGAGAYWLSLDSGNQPSGTFSLRASGGRHSLPYCAVFKGTGGSEQTFTRAGYTREPYYGHRLSNCGGGTNASIRIEVTGTNKAPTGIYREVMMVTVEPW